MSALMHSYQLSPTLPGNLKNQDLMVIFAQNGGVRSLGQAHLMRLGVTPTLVGSADNTLVKLKLQYKKQSCNLWNLLAAWSRASCTIVAC